MISLRRGPVAVLGGGAWGTALANAAAAASRDVVLWMRDPDLCARMRETGENDRYLPGVRLSPRIAPVSELGRLREATAVLAVVPAQSLRETLASLSDALPRGAPLVLCAKGIERGSGFFLTDVARELRPDAPVAALSGPSFADDVARGLPTAVTLACEDGGVAEALAGLLSGPTFRVYHGTDLRGVEIGGAAKNVLAIACGAVIGRGLGESARAALIARGFAELLRFAKAYGGRPETLMGLSGLGDLVLTCGSAQSRNFAFGERLGRGMPVEEAAGGKLAEGVHTASVLVGLARRAAVEMPVSEAVDALVSGRTTLDQTIAGLMGRPLKPEHR